VIDRGPTIVSRRGVTSLLIIAIAVVPIVILWSLGTSPPPSSMPIVGAQQGDETILFVGDWGAPPNEVT
jgi:hypothetical protein